MPLTSRKSAERVIYPNEVLIPAEMAGLKVASIALCYQIRTVDRTQLDQHYGELTNPELQNQIAKAIKFQLYSVHFETHGFFGTR